MNTESPAPPLRFRPLLGAASLALVVGVGAQAINPLDRATMEEDDNDSLPALEMLIEGSILRKVMIPQYDESRRLVSLLRAEKLTMVHDGLIDARILRLEFYNPDRSQKALIDLAKARLEDQKILRSSDPVSLVSDELNVNGTGLVLELENSRGFIVGPAEASALIDTQTAMNTTPRTRSAIAGIMIASAAVVAGEGLDKLDDQQVEGLNKLAVSMEKEAKALADQAAESLAESEKQSKQAQATLDDFLRRAALKEVEGEAPDLSTKVPDPPVPTNETRARITAEDGIYFDSEAGLLVLLKNVEVEHPEFTMTGADEVKVFFDQKEDEAKPESGKIKAEEGEKLLGGGRFGEPSKIIATGAAIRIKKIKTDADDKHMEASGRQLVIDLANDEAIIRGGQPWVMSESITGRVVTPDGLIRFNIATGDASAVGDLEAFIPVKAKN